MIDIQEIIKKELRKLSIDVESGAVGTAKTAAEASGAPSLLAHPKSLGHGDYSFFVKEKKIDPAALALEKIKHEYIEKVAVAGKFINFTLSPKFFADSLQKIIKDGVK